MKKYRTESTSWRVKAEITEVEVVKETAKQVVVQYKEKPWNSDKERTYERRENKISQCYRFHDTWEEAHAFLLSAAEAKVEQARRSLEEYKSYLGNVKGMKKPS